MESMWIYTMMFLSVAVLLFVVAYKKEDDWEKRTLGKLGYKRIYWSKAEKLLTRFAKHQSGWLLNDRIYLAILVKGLGKEWTYRYKAHPFLCEISRVSEENGEIVFLFLWQGEGFVSVLIFYKGMRRKERDKSVETLLRSLLLTAPQNLKRNIRTNF